MLRKLLIIAGFDGLILQNQRTDAAVKIDYKTHSILPQLQDVNTEQPTLLSLETHGIVGMYTVGGGVNLEVIMLTACKASLLSLLHLI